MTDTKALIEEAREYDQWDVRAEPASNTLDLIRRLADALERAEGERMTHKMDAEIAIELARLPRQFRNP